MSSSCVNITSTSCFLFSHVLVLLVLFVCFYSEYVFQWLSIFHSLKKYSTLSFSQCTRYVREYYSDAIRVNPILNAFLLPLWEFYMNIIFCLTGLSAVWTRHCQLIAKTIPHSTAAAYLSHFIFHSGSRLNRLKSSHCRFIVLWLMDLSEGEFSLCQYAFGHNMMRRCYDYMIWWLRWLDAFYSEEYK